MLHNFSCTDSRWVTNVIVDGAATDLPGNKTEQFVAKLI